MTPYLVTAPASLPVTLSDLKDYRRKAGFDDDDTQLEALQQSAVAHLDGWGGVLNRCIMPQTWAIDVTGPGPHVLPFPDASSVTAESADVAISVETTRSGMGTLVTIADAVTDQAVTISAVYGMSAQRLPAAKALVKLMVGSWDSNREAVVVGTISSALPLAAEALIAALRWRRV